MSETAYRTTPLFGGAITADIPASWKDVSDFRHVPDTQEVWVSPDTSAEGEISFILEVLEHVEPERPEDAIKFHFEALAEDNSAESHSVDRIWTSSTPSTSAQTPSPTLLAGTQSVRKYGRQSAAPAPVQIYVALWRYPQRKTDLVMSFNVAGVASSTSAQQAAVLATFERAASSLALVDANLFG
ncbi:hypothetical protein OC861_004359 [Tilletia horrida]|nr:hypothetical protein OC861_004359 [Tilletia horrida]